MYSKAGKNNIGRSASNNVKNCNSYIIICYAKGCYYKLLLQGNQIQYQESYIV